MQSVSLWILIVLVLAPSLFLSVQDHKFFSELLIFHAEFLSYLNKSSQTVDIFWVLFVNFLVNLKSFVEKIHSSVAGRNHEWPLDLLRLHLLSTFEINNSFFKHVIFSMVHTQARDHINFCGIVPIRLGVEVNGLELVLLLLIQIAHLSEDLTVTWYFGYQNVVPLESLASHAD